MNTELLAQLTEAVRRHLDTGDEQIDEDNLLDLVLRVGDPVYGLDWDSGGPGAGAGTESVYRVGDVYVAVSSTFGLGDPCATLDEAVGAIFVSGATRTISCAEWSEEEIIARMYMVDGPPVLEINGTDWPFEHLELAYQRLHPMGGEEA